MLIKAVLILLMVLSVASFANALDITIAYEDKAQPPYYMGSGKVLEKAPGVAVEMVLMIKDMLEDINIHLLRMPWMRCTSMLGRNRVDGIFNASYKQSRLALGWYPTVDHTQKGQVDTSRRIATITYSLYALKGNQLGWNGSNYDSLKGKIGAPIGYSIVGDLRKQGVLVEEASSTLLNLRKLSAKRVVAVALQDVTADSIIKSDGDRFGNIVKLHPPLKTKPYYLMLSNNFVSAHPKVSQKIWDSIRIIRESKLTEITRKYSK